MPKVKGKMPKLKPKKVCTPGSRPANKSPGGRGRPKKAKAKVRGRRLQYSQELILQAIEAVRNKEMTMGEAAKHFGVPKTTIFDRLHTSSGVLGRKPELTDEEENVIVSRPELGKVNLKFYYFKFLPFIPKLKLFLYLSYFAHHTYHIQA
jgi:transposase-like protein